MSALQITITDAGRAAVINAENTGTAPITIAQIGFGSGQYTPNNTQTALVSETKRVSTIAGLAIADDTLHLVAKDESSDAYDVGEFGLFTDAGVLFAVYSQPVGSGWIIEKSAVSTLLLAVDVILETLDAASITFGDLAFINPPASETVAGVALIATQAQTDTGTNDTAFITSKKLKAWAKQATESVLGMLKVATQAQTDAGTDDATVVTPKKLKAWVKQATESVLGMLKVATQAQTDAGSDDATVVTPKKLKAWVKQATESVLGMLKVATQAQTDAGTDDATVVTPKKLAARLASLVLKQEYSSPEQTITPAGSLTLPHGLGAVPKTIQAMLVCKVADSGYSVGDIVFIHTSHGDDGASGTGMSLIASSTEIRIRFGSNSGVFILNNPASGSRDPIAAADWRLLIRAFA